MRILVTGGAGFIGSHLCERLLKEGHRVVAVDNFLTGSPRNLANFQNAENFKLIEHDINLSLPAEIIGSTNMAPGYGVKDELKFDQVYHLACPASPVDYREIPLQTLLVNGVGTRNVIEVAVRHHAAFLLASTSEIYGDPAVHPQPESYWGNVNPIGERSCYSEGKRYAESMAMAYYRDFQFPLKIVRIFNTYGPRMRKHDGRVMPSFIQAALMDEPLPVHGDGLQTRSFCYVDDLIDGLLAVMKTSADFTGPLNLGNPQEITIADLAKKIIALTKSQSLISHREAVKDDPVRRCPDITLAQKQFAFQPKIGLEAGLQKTVEFFRLLH